MLLAASPCRTKIFFFWILYFVIGGWEWGMLCIFKLFRFLGFQIGIFQGRREARACGGGPWYPIAKAWRPFAIGYQGLVLGRRCAIRMLPHGGLGSFTVRIYMWVAIAGVCIASNLSPNNCGQFARLWPSLLTHIVNLLNDCWNRSICNWLAFRWLELSIRCGPGS